MRLLIALLVILFSFTGCQVVLFTVMGIKPLKPETAQSLQRYERKVGYDFKKNNFYLDSAKTDQIWKGAFPKAFIYDKAGNTVMFLDCFRESMPQIKHFFNLPQESRKKVSDTLRILLGQDTILHIAPKFQEMVSSVKPLSPNSHFLQPGTDYYIVYFWSTSFGRINKKYGSKMEQYIEEHPEFNASFIKINCDYQKDWGYTKKQLRTDWR